MEKAVGMRYWSRGVWELMWRPRATRKWSATAVDLAGGNCYLFGVLELNRGAGQDGMAHGVSLAPSCGHR